MKFKWLSRYEQKVVSKSSWAHQVFCQCLTPVNSLLKKQDPPVVSKELKHMYTHYIVKNSKVLADFFMGWTTITCGYFQHFIEQFCTCQSQKDLFIDFNRSWSRLLIRKSYGFQLVVVSRRSTLLITAFQVTVLRKILTWSSPKFLQQRVISLYTPVNYRKYISINLSSAVSKCDKNHGLNECIWSVSTTYVLNTQPPERFQCCEGRQFCQCFVQPQRKKTLFEISKLCASIDSKLKIALRLQSLKQKILPSTDRY